MSWAWAFVLTVAVETPLIGWLGRRLGWFGGRLGHLGRLVSAAVLINLVTHPLLWLVRPRSTPALLIAEIVIVLVEAALWWALVRQRPAACLGVAFVANAVSFAVGLAVGLLKG